jgi:ribonuclease J
MTVKTLRFVPLGGLGEVGKNMMSLEYGDNVLVVDTGIMFPENDMLGIDYIIPDFGYLKDKRDKIRGIVVTHGHEDHTGAIRHVLEEIPAPIYATPLTRGLLEVKLSRGGMLKGAKLNTVQAGERVKLGPFEVEFFHVCHSIPDGVGLGITTPAGLIVHSGDYKFDHTPVDGWPTDLASWPSSKPAVACWPIHQRRRSRLDALRGGHRWRLRPDLPPGQGPHPDRDLRLADLAHAAGG